MFAALALLLLNMGSADAQRLSRALDDLAEAPALDGATIAGSVRRVSDGRVLWEREADRAVIPASTVKWLTAAVAVETLGFEHQFETRLETDGELSDGVLSGDLILVGGGDPAFGRRVLDAWAAEVAGSLGVREVAGTVRADTSLLAGPSLGSGWAWDDLPSGYAAPYSALTIDLNTTQVSVTARETPSFDGGSLGSCLQFTATEDPGALSLTRRLGHPQVIALGAARPDAGTRARWITVPDPAACAVELFAQALRDAGVVIHDAPHPSGDRALLRAHASPPLHELLATMLSYSQNLYAELLARAVDPAESGRSFSGARSVYADMLTRAGVADGTWRLEDGSGLSRYNLLSAEALNLINQYIRAQPYADGLLGLLPTAGVDGTLARRMTDGPATGRVHAKTGSMSNVRNLTGYVTTADDQLLAVTLLVNGDIGPRGDAIGFQDTALELLAAMTLRDRRRPRVRPQG